MLLPNFSDAKVLVFGDVMLDRYWLGSANRISPEAPVPVVQVKQEEVRVGGAANVAANLVSLGAQAQLFGYVGEDAAADELRALLDDAKIKHQLQALANYPTVTKLRIISQAQQLLRADFEESMRDLVDANLIEAFTDQLPLVDAVILSDYAKGALDNSVELIRLCREHDTPVYVDPKHLDFSVYHGATVLTPNRKEFEAVVGPCRSFAEMTDKACQLIKRYDFTAMLITLSGDGMLLVNRDGSSTHLPVASQEVRDVTGAGDTVIATFVAAAAAGCDLTNAMMLANQAASLVIRKLGAASVTEEELRHSLQNNESSLGVVSEAELLQLLRDERGQGKRIVMTNGCFDILHPGHLHYLEQAKSLGDVLVVAVNDDESVRRLKGKTRPINPLLDRMQMLAGLRAVDWVVSFSEDTPERLIGAVLPDVLVKGGDYTVEQIAGHKSVINNGGEVVILGFKDGYSTTSWLEKLSQH